MSLSKHATRWTVNLLAWAVTLAFLFPLVYATSLSFMPEAETIAFPPHLLPQAPTLVNYQQVLATADQPVLTWFWNSFVAATGYATLSLVVCTAAAYALSRFRFRFGRVYFRIILVSMTIPGIIFLIPNYTTISDLGLTDNLWAIILPGLGSTIGVFLLRQFMIGIPQELIEAATIDGAGSVRRLFAVVLPLSREALISLWVMGFMANWNDYLWPLVVIYDATLRTMPLGMATLQGPYVSLYGPLMAGAMMLAAPSVLIFLLVQKYYLRGISLAGAIKE